MLCCLNPNCEEPLNPSSIQFCQSCKTKLIPLLRNRFRIIKPIGRGGFGCTYLAEDTDNLNEPCVVKRLAPQFQGNAALLKATELFKQEAYRLQQLGGHPQIPKLYAYFEEYGYLYLVQEYINGQNLSQELIQKGVFNEKKVEDFLSDLLPVIKIVHEQKVIHRDIKPENILRHKSDGKLILIDFGIAKQETATSLTKPGSMIGTNGYAPYEQMVKGRVYPASDLYSLGVTCFHLLTRISPSKLLCQEDFYWTYSWQQHLKKPISKELENILDKLLQKQYQDRYQSAAEVLKDLNFLKQRGTITFNPVPLPTSTPQSPNKKASIWQLFPSAIITSAGSSFLAIALLSFSGMWIAPGLWLLIIGVIIFGQSRSRFEKAYLFVIASITTLAITSIFQHLYEKNLFQAGFYGILTIFLLVMSASLLTFTIMILSRIFNRLFSNVF